MNIIQSNINTLKATAQALKVRIYQDHMKPHLVILPMPVNAMEIDSTTGEVTLVQYCPGYRTPWGNIFDQDTLAGLLETVASNWAHQEYEGSASEVEQRLNSQEAQKEEYAMNLDALKRGTITLEEAVEVHEDDLPDYYKN